MLRCSLWKTGIQPPLPITFLSFLYPSTRQLALWCPKYFWGENQAENAEDEGPVSLSRSVQQRWCGTSNTILVLVSFSIPGRYFHAGAARLILGTCTRWRCQPISSFIPEKANSGLSPWVVQFGGFLCVNSWCLLKSLSQAGVPLQCSLLRCAPIGIHCCIAIILWGTEEKTAFTVFRTRKCLQGLKHGWI